MNCRDKRSECSKTPKSLPSQTKFTDLSSVYSNYIVIDRIKYKNIPEDLIKIDDL